MRVRQSHVGPIGIDIGTSSIKLLQIDHAGERPVVSAAAWRAVPAGLTDTDRLTFAFGAMRAMLDAHPFRGRRAVLALQPTQYQIKSFRLPRMPAEELEGALVFEAEERFAFGDDGGEFRHISAGDVRQGNEIKEELIIFGARRPMLADLLARMELLRLEPVAIDAAPCAMARSFGRFLRRAQDATAINVFVDVGRSNTSLVITRGPQVVFVKTIDMGGQRFDEAVASRLGVSAEQAGEVRVAAMQTGPGARRDQPAASEETEISGIAPGSVREQISDALRPAAEHLAKELQLCLRYFAVTFRGPRPDSLTLVGGEAHEPALMSWLPPIVDVQCLIGDPLRSMNIAVDGGLPGSWTLRPAWSVAAGLALRGSRWVQPVRIDSSATAQTRPAVPAGV